MSVLISRMDIDHSGRYLAQKFYKIRDPDYYEFEGIRYDEIFSLKFMLYSISLELYHFCLLNILR
jgi:hypothetical protein